MTVRVRLLYRNAGDHIAFRDASEYVGDPRDRADMRAALATLDRQHATALAAIEHALAGKMSGKTATLADFDAAVVGRSAEYARHAEERDRLIAAARERGGDERAGSAGVIEKLTDEIEFDHVPSEAELAATFPGRKKSVA